MLETPTADRHVPLSPWRVRIDAGEGIIAWQRALHYGEGLGGIYKFLVFVSGVIIPVFAVTGFLMWWLKRRNRRAGEKAKRAILDAARQSAD